MEPPHLPHHADRGLNIHGLGLRFTRRRRYKIASFPPRVDFGSGVPKPSGMFVQGSTMQLTGSQFPGNVLQICNSLA